ncbi:hypothetical protein [Brevundimonas sp.]|uniref:hypothetical protein n=1 Tax=Brevundimonas sp. TaxID=1871086 RepID=UPI002737C3F7|nr:hypothetical protein [Brevundimonas sp.]MDP3800960.1 hypothetical protein [Brevundimonas sp.]
MHSLLFALALSVLLTPQTPPVSTAPDAAAPAAAAPATDPGDRVVCRREHVLGSNRRERICMTVRQRAQLEDQSRQQLDRAGRGSDRNDLPGDRNTGL